MSREDLREKMETILSMVPLSSAADTIRSFCLRYEKCSKECPLYNAHGKGCYFNNVTPDKWEAGGIIYKMTEEVGGKKNENR